MGTAMNQRRMQHTIKDSFGFVDMTGKALEGRYGFAIEERTSDSRRVHFVSAKMRVLHVMDSSNATRAECMSTIYTVVSGESSIRIHDLATSIVASELDRLFVLRNPRFNLLGM